MAQIASREFRLQLKSLSIAGFKSFARPVTLEFPDGITALVGANGSGKSNVVDAVRWCLGEQSVRDLRGQRAEDVIHAGKRRVLGSAEVSLCFEGGDAPDLLVSRRLLRSGESDYLINGNRRRLRDVQDVLSGLGMDHPRFVVVTQGMTDFLLSATAAERRALLEQAAGLASYRQRRDDAAHKLSSAEQNMVTVEAVLSELDPRIRSLHRQVRALEARDELVERLTRRQAIWYAARSREISEQLSLARDELAGAEAERESARTVLAGLEDEAERAIGLEREWQRRVEAASSALHEAQRQLDTVVHAREMWERRLADLARIEETLERRLTDLDAETAAAISRHAQVGADVEAASAASRAAGDAHERARSQVRLLEAENAEREKSARSLKGDADRLRAEREDLSRAVVGLDARLAEVAAHVQRLREAAEYVGRARGELQREEVAARAAVESTRAQLGELGSAADESSRELASADEKLMRLRSLQLDAGERLRSLEHRWDAVNQEYRSLSREMASTALADLDVVEGAERAIDAALYGWQMGFTRAGSLPGDFINWRDRLCEHFPAGACWADKLATGPEVPAVLLATIVAPSPAEADRLWHLIAPLPAHRLGSPAIQIVTREGGLITGQGRREHVADDRGARLLTARGELRRMDRELVRVRRNVSRLAVVGEALRRQREQAAAADRERRAEVRAQQAVLIEAETVLHRLEARETRLEQEEQELVAEMRRRQESLSELGSAMTDSRERLSLVSGSLQEREAAAAEAEVQLLQTHASLAAARRSVGEVAEDVAILARRLQALSEMARSSEAEVARLQLEPSRLKSERAAIELEAAGARHELEQVEESIRDRAAVVAVREAEFAAARAARPGFEDRGAALRAARDRSDRAIARYERAAARLSETEGAGSRLRDEIVRETGSERLPEIVDENEAPPTEDEIRRLRNRAAAYSEFDPSIEPEYRELIGRRDYLTAQMTDLRATAEGLREVMRVADSEMRTRFSRALTRVSDEFERVFRVMFRGGEASLEQTDDGGVDVRSSLPGKRARSSASFSGGERALVASSLLFAVLRIRPAPFCVLDEVDAALDETNVDRYLEALRDLAARMQTIVVTHNRASMAAATALYGLTIDGEGASNVLSLRLDQYDAAVS